jgi:hypothetical protein
MKINLKANLNFSKLSKDKNKIHINENFAKNFFIKKTISHGANLVLKMLNFYFKKNKNKQFKKIEVIFTKPTYTNEEFNFRLKKNLISLVSNKENNIKIFFKTEKNKSTQFVNLKKLILEISRIVGNHQNKPSLILQFKIFRKKNHINQKKVIKLKKNIYNLKYSNSFYISDTLFVKLKEKEKIKFVKKNNANKNKKKVLLFGKNSDLAVYTSNYLKSLGFKIKFFPKYYFDRKNLKTAKFKLEAFLKDKSFDYIFYYISPKIEPYKKKNYKFLYLDIFKIIYNQTKNCGTKIFYPSTKYIQYKNPAFKDYIASKIIAEKWITHNDKEKLVSIIRLPQLRSSQTYNLLGFYEGSKISILKNKLNSFIK